MSDELIGPEHVAATEMDLDAGRAKMVAFLRDKGQFATETTELSAGISLMGWGEPHIDNAINMYVALRTDMKNHATALVGVQIYLEAIRTGKSHANAYVLAMKVHDVAPQVPQPVEDDVTAIAAAKQTRSGEPEFSVGVGSVMRDRPSELDGYTLPVTPNNFGVTASPFDHTLSSAAPVRADVAAALVGPAFSATVAPAPETLQAAPVPPAARSVKESPLELTETVKKAYKVACEKVLRKLKFDKFAEEGASVFALFFAAKMQPEVALAKAKHFCELRAEGYEINPSITAAKEADVTATEEEIKWFKEALHEQPGISRVLLAAIIAGIIVLVVGGATAAYVSSTAHQDTQPDGQTAPNP